MVQDAHHPTTRRKGSLTALVCAAALVAFAVLSFSAVRTKNATVDEPLHALAGWLWSHQHDYRLDPEDPPLWGYWMALPNGPHALRADFESPDWRRIPQTHWTQTPWWRQTLYGTPGNDAEALVGRSRAMALVLGVLLGALVAWWAWQLAGAPAAVVAVGLFAFDPNFLAHAPLVKNDVAISLLLLATAYATWQFGRRATVPRVLAIGLLCGAAMSTKFSGVLFLPIVAILLAIRAAIKTPWTMRRRKIAPRPPRVAVLAVACVFAGAVAVLVIWSSYGFRFSATGDPSLPMNNRLQAALVTRAKLMLEHPDHRPTAGELAATPPSLAVRAALFLSDHHLAPEAWVNGLLYTDHTSLVRPGYLLGEVRESGWWYYFPLAVFFKTPLATLAALALAAGVGVASLRRGVGAETAWAMVCLLVPPALYFAVAMTTHLNLGLRHVLPVYPPLFVAAGVAFATVWQSRPRVAGAVAGVLLVGLLVATAAAWPDYIPFFNVAAGGSRGGLRLLGDSNLDWGQDLKSLGEWQRRHENVPLHLHYFGSVDPRLYVRAEPFDPSALAWPAGPGVLAVSATHLQGIYLSPQARAFYAPLRDRQPLAVIGGSIYLFDNPGQTAGAPP